MNGYDSYGSTGTFDRYDAEWEHRDTGRTVSFSRDDDYCEHCDTDQAGCGCV